MVIPRKFKYGKTVPHLLKLSTFVETQLRHHICTKGQPTARDPTQGREELFQKELLHIHLLKKTKQAPGDYAEWKRRSRGFYKEQA